jgi:hypothetical protein
MKVDKKNCNRIEIWSPRYHDALDNGNYVVLLAKYKIAAHNIVWFSKAKHLAGKEYYMAGNKIQEYPIESNGKISCYVVPLPDMELISDVSQSWDTLVAEIDDLERKAKLKEQQ